MNQIKVMVVDDSALMRKIISDMINSEQDMKVVTTARNGQELLEKIPKFNPDIITLDVEMPKMDGMTALKEMRNRKMNIPTIVLSSVSKQSVNLTMECLAKGAFDFLAKPSGAISLDIDKVKKELIQKIRVAAKEINDKVKIRKKKVETPRLKRISKRIDAVVIGASTGGPKALYSVITKLPKDLNVPVFVVQHMPVGFTKAFADRLNRNSNLEVVEASENDIIQKNVVYIAPGGFHMQVEKDKRIHLNKEPAIWGVRPAVDKLFYSASDVYGAHLISVVLTGMGKDGSQGTAYIKDNGGITVSEDESTCTIYGMPKAAYETGKVDIVLPLTEISDEITKVVKETGR
ncbi:chemotaxis response regulator protein-glutamate methylesterase [Haloimpatiens sp. FM7330]|uniref:protein-glutamate methylesterase/protein-glutamine glutaminase n=1 Tax=Haloimpatiens sp. FM7330 TaxID=3298610 RepID=UPI00362FA3AA